MLVVTAIVAVLASVAIPTMLQAAERMRLGQSTREVEREMQAAKQRAVARQRAMRIRFNCPQPGQFRIVELIGTPLAPAGDDSAPDRCSTVRFPYPARDNDIVTRPNLDGPVRLLDPTVAFGAVETLEFWPDGTVHHAPSGQLSNWPMVPPAGVAITLTRSGTTSTLTVNGLGRIQVQ